jgi:hypothetical protein
MLDGVVGNSDVLYGVFGGASYLEAAAAFALSGNSGSSGFVSNFFGIVELVYGIFRMFVQ